MPAPFLFSGSWPQVLDSNVTDADGLFQRREWFAFGDEFLCDISLEAGGDDGLHDAWVIQFLRLINFGATGNAACVVVIEVLMILPDRIADVAIHDLHVEDVVEQFEPFRADAFDQFNAPRGVIALIVFVAAFAVQQFHHERDFVLFGERHEALQSDGAVFQALLIVETSTVPGETNHALVAIVGGLFDALFVSLD